MIRRDQLRGRVAIVLGAAALTAGVLVAIYRRASTPLLEDPARGGAMITMVAAAFVLLAFLAAVAAFQTYNGANRGAASGGRGAGDVARRKLFHPTRRRTCARSWSATAAPWRRTNG